MSDYTVPSSDTAFEEMSNLLQHCDKGELQELMDNEERLNGIVADLEEVKKIQVYREMMVASNRSIAEYNLNLEPKLVHGKEMLVEAHKNKEVIQKDFDKNKGKLDTFASSYNPDTTLALLQTATAQAEEEAEKTVDMFLDGETSVEDFMQKFLKEKALHHMRHVKTEKLAELVKQRVPQSYSYRF